MYKVKMKKKSIDLNQFKTIFVEKKISKTKRNVFLLLLL